MYKLYQLSYYELVEIIEEAQDHNKLQRPNIVTTRFHTIGRFDSCASKRVNTNTTQGDTDGLTLEYILRFPSSNTLSIIITNPSSTFN